MTEDRGALFAMRGLGRMCRRFRHFRRQLSNAYDTQRVSGRLRSMLFARLGARGFRPSKASDFPSRSGKGTHLIRMG